jgi:hypothetical protein
MHGAPRARFYAGLFALTFSTLALEVLQTRLLSVVAWYHLAFFVISSAMFGMTGGAVWAYWRRRDTTPDDLPDQLRDLATAYAVSTALTLAFQVTLAPVTVRSATMLVVFAELSLAMAVPFFFSGAAVSLALTRSSFPIGAVYAVDLLGAAFGCLGVLAILAWIDAPSAILLAGATGALAAMLFSMPRDSAADRARQGRSAASLWGWLRRPGLVFSALLVLGIANASTRHGLQPMVVKDRVEKRRASELLYEKWNCFSRVVAAPPELAPPALWGPSPKLPAGLEVEQIDMNIDGSAGTTMVRFDGRLQPVGFLAYDITNLAYYLDRPGRAAIIGVGGGRDIVSALRFGARDVTGVELNPIFVDLLRHREPFRGFAGIAGAPGVRLVVDEARSWFSRTPDRFDRIQMSMIDTWAATGAGAFTLTENGLYTVEAWTMFFRHLTDRGVFTVSRWHGAGEVNETGRMMSLAVAALLELGVQRPREHLFLASSGSSGSPIATLVLCRSPFDPADLATLHRECRELGFRELLSPDAPAASPLLESIVTAESRAALHARVASLELDLTPPRDDRPFFFNMLRLDKPQVALRYAGAGSGVVAGNLAATWSLLTILAVSFVLVITTIVAPLRHSIRETGAELVKGGTAYFALLGLGFMFVEIGLLQRLSVFLGHPVYSLSIVLFSLILTTGVGSIASERWTLETPGSFRVWALATAVYVAALPAWMPAALGSFQTAGIPVRAALAAGLIAPAGMLMGFGFPTGMRMTRRHDERPAPWFWGINGAAGVLASVLAVVLSITYGTHVTLIGGALCYLGLVPAAAMIRASREAITAHATARV